MSNINWRTINIDALDPESSANFDTSELAPAIAPASVVEIQQLGQQCRQLLRGGDAEGALRGALEGTPYGGDQPTKVRGAIQAKPKISLYPWC
jgi:actin related protein 2/3 complex, subunit 5